jgi:Undecaprenyl-phosphate galactose phosphotransferase WbaP
MVIGVNSVVELRQLTRLNSLVFLAILIATYVVSAQPFWRAFFTVQWAALLLLVPLLRAGIRRQCAKTNWWGQPALIFGPTLAADAIARLLAQRPTGGLRPIALVCEQPGSDRLATCGLPVIDVRTAGRLARRSAVSYGVVVAGADSADRAAPLAMVAGLSLPHVLLTSDDTSFPTLWCDSLEFGGMHALAINNRLLLPWPRFVKRASDLVLTVVGGILISPLLLAVAVTVKLTNPGPIFFAHTRIGRNGRPFKAWKFRTMRRDAEAILAQYLADDPDLAGEWERDHKLKNDPRVTPIGKFLRKTSLDEFPQLWNVLKGDMSLVGPRPIVFEEIAKYGEIFSQFVRVSPGITGLWQVSGRNNISYRERVGLDNYYVSNWSPWLDMHIIARTFGILLLKRGAY